MDIFWGIIAGLFNGVGALLIFFKQKYSDKELNKYLNLAAGIMLAAAFFSLLEPARNNLLNSYNKYMASLIFAGGLICGYLFLNLLNHLIPHIHIIKTDTQRNIILFVLAIALHKVPEGIAMGIAYANNKADGNALTLGILLQNIPEGLSVALSLLTIKFSKWKAVLISALTGLMQPVGMGCGLILSIFGNTFINFSMIIAGSALLFVVINEVLPQTYRTHEDIKNSISLFIGFFIMSIIGILL